MKSKLTITKEEITVVDIELQIGQCIKSGIYFGSVLPNDTFLEIISVNDWVAFGVKEEAPNWAKDSQPCTLKEFQEVLKRARVCSSY